MQILQADVGYQLNLRFFLMNHVETIRLLNYEDIQIQIDPFTKRYLGEVTQIDYTDEEGFLVGEIFASGDCAI